MSCLMLFESIVIFQYIYIPQCKTWKNTQSKTKPIKTKKQFGTTHCLGCKDYTHNFRILA